jgi:hypothetical protein
MNRTRNAISAANGSASRKKRDIRASLPLLGVAVRFGNARAHRSSKAVPRAVALKQRQHTRCVRAGCPSCGGQRTVWFASKNRCTRLCSTVISSLRRSSITKDQQPGVRAVAPHSRGSLALRLSAAPGTLGRAGIGFAHATTAGAFGQGTSAAIEVRGGVRPSNGASNPSFKRTHNGGPRLLASSSSAAPLCAA